MTLRIDLTNEQDRHPVDAERLRQGAQAVLEGEGIHTAAVSLAIIDDPAMHQLNREFLEHDYPTDVLSFLLDSGPGMLEGEVIASADTAAKEAERFNTSTADELLLYVIHGTLHLVGFDDTTNESAAEMREREAHYLARFGVEHRWEPKLP